MTVAELIQRLHEFPEDMRVLRGDNSTGYEEIHCVKEEEILDTMNRCEEFKAVVID